MNKDRRFRKKDQYVFFLLWQKEMQELASGVYNMFKGTPQHAMPVKDFVDRVSKNEEEVEANLSTMFQNMRGSNQYWFLRRSDVLCMVREYGSPTLSHPQLWRVRQPRIIHLPEEGEQCE